LEFAVGSFLVRPRTLTVGQELPLAPVRFLAGPRQVAIHKASHIRPGDSKRRALGVQVRIWLSVLHPVLCSSGGGSWPLAHEVPARLQLDLL
jgi:hypothetical protein